MRFVAKQSVKIIIFLLMLLNLYPQSVLVYANENDPRQTAYALAIEGDYVYIAGNAVGLSGYLPEGSLNMSGGMEDIWLIKLKKDGTPVFQALIGGSFSDSAYGITVHQGVVYLIGETWSSDFPAAPGSAGENDSVILAIAADGSGILWARRFGGSDQDSGRAISFSGNSIYFTGITWSKDFISGQTKGDADGFLGRIEVDGSLSWLKVFGGNLLDAPFDIVSNESQVWITGQTYSFNFGATPIGGGDIFLTRFSTEGLLEFNGMFGGKGEDLGFALSLTDGEVIIIGATQSEELVLPLGEYVDDFDTLIMKLNTNHEVVFSRYLGGTGHDYGYDVKSLPNGDSVVVGVTYSPSFPSGNDQELTTSGNGDGFIVLVSSDGDIGELLLIGGEDSDRASAFDYDAEGFWIAGQFSDNELAYLTYLESNIFSLGPLPTNQPPLATATPAVTATSQPTETPIVINTESSQDTGSESQEMHEPTQETPEMVISQTQSQADISHSTQSVSTPQLSSTGEEIKIQVTDSFEKPIKNDSGFEVTIIIVTIIFVAIIILFLWMKSKSKKHNLNKF